MSKEMECHEICDMLPRIDAKELFELAQDIKKNGQQQPILLLDGKILDGRHRYLACQQAQVVPVFKEYAGSLSPADLVVAMNIRRRHLSASQRAMLATSFAKLHHGQNQMRNIAHPPSQTEAAQELNVSRRAVQDARVVADGASPNLRQAVVDGVVPVHAAAAKVRAERKATAAKPSPAKAAPVEDQRIKFIADKAAEFEAFLDIASELSALRKRTLDACKMPLGAFINSQQVASLFDDLIFQLRSSKPVAVCPYCGGDGCKVCRKQGWVTKTLFENAPRELKAKAIKAKEAR